MRKNSIRELKRTAKLSLKHAKSSVLTMQRNGRRKLASIWNGTSPLARSVSLRFLIPYSCREANAKRKLEKKTAREWDAEKKERTESSAAERGRGGGRGRGRGRGSYAVDIILSASLLLSYSY